MFGRILMFALLGALLAFKVEAKIVEFDSFKLNNGLEVVVVSNNRAPVGYLKLYYKVGAINDPYFKGGIAHLVEHLMFRGTKNVKDKEFNRITEENGASDNAFTTYLNTGYYEFADISKLELMMALEADRMVNLDISDEAFIKERDIVLQERLQRFETNPVVKFYEKMGKIFWDKHLFARPVSGEVLEIKNLQKEDAENFYRKYYKPSNALLILAGDIKKDEAKELVLKYFGKIKSVENEDVAEVELDEPIDDEIWLKMKLLGVEHKRFVAYWYLPKDKFSKKEILTLELLSEFLSGDDTSYLYDKLVYGDKKFLSIGVDVDYDENLGGQFSFYGLPSDENMSMEEFSNIVIEEMGRGVSALSEGELEKIKNENLSNAVYLLDDVRGVADFIGGMKLENYEDDDIKNFDEIIKSVKLCDVKEVYKKVLELAKRKVYGELDKKKIEFVSKSLF